MKATKILLIAVWVAALQFTNIVLAQTFNVKSYKVTVNGTSNLHDWESRVEKLEAQGSFVASNSTLTDLKSVLVKIPVTALKGSKGRIMDNKTYDAFDHEKNPNIIFTLTDRSIDAGNNTLKLSGNLAMAGVTRPIDVTVKYKFLPGGELQVSGSKKLNMTEFKMEPPTAMMGAIEVGEEITVTFEFVLTQNGIVKTKN